MVSKTGARLHLNTVIEPRRSVCFLADIFVNRDMAAESEPLSDMEDEPQTETTSPVTPDIWMRKWLQLHRQSLVDNLQNAIDRILDVLVQKGHINPLRSVAYQQITSDSTVPVQKARKLLDWLSVQPPAVFWSFQHAIRHSALAAAVVERLVVSDEEMRELSELVEGMSMSEKLSLARSPAVLAAREKLQKFYRSRDELVMSAGLAKGKKMPMDKIMVNVCLLSPEEVREAFEGRSFSSEHDQKRSNYLFSKILAHQASFLSLEDVFKATEEHERDPDKALATGGAGCGKSTCFTRKAPYEWALGRLWRQFALLFCLELRDKSVWKAKTIAELLKLSQLGLSADEQEEVVEFITNHPDQVVVVCDGLDEGSVDDSSFLWNVLEGNCVGVPASLRVVVTTRPCEAAGKLAQSLSCSYRGVEVVGFKKDDIALFVRKYLGEEDGKKLLSQLDVQSSITGLMHAPLLCLLVCDLFKEDHVLPPRITEIFEKIVTALLRVFAKSHGLRKPFRDIAQAPAKVKELLVALGKLAFEGLIKKQMYFTEVELDESGVSPEALELGLLTKSEVTEFWKEDEYAFSHLTLQEFVAALYVSTELLQVEADMKKLLEKVSFDDGHLSTFWLFAAGLLTGEMTETFFSTLAKIINSSRTDSFLWRQGRGNMHITASHRLTLPLFRYFAESHMARNGALSCSVSEVLKQDGVNISGRLSESKLSLWSMVVNSHAKTGCITEVKLHNVFRLPAPVAMVQFLLCLQKCRSIKIWTVINCDLPPQVLSTMSAVLGDNAATLKKAEFRRNRIGDEGLEVLAKGLKQCRGLIQLCLQGELLSTRSSTTLRNIVSGLPSLETLHLGQNDLGNSGLEKLAERLQFCTGLRHLQLEDNHLSGRSNSAIAQMLHALTALETAVVLRGNHFSQREKVALRALLASHPTLKAFNCS